MLAGLERSQGVSRSRSWTVNRIRYGIISRLQTTYKSSTKLLNMPTRSEFVYSFYRHYMACTYVNNSQINNLPALLLGICLAVEFYIYMPFPSSSQKPSLIDGSL